MPRRDLIKTANKVTGCIPYQYDLTIEEMRQLDDIAREQDIYEAIMLAFNYGYVVGHRITKSGKYKENR